jgi:excisionase family DNA binding protein
MSVATTSKYTGLGRATIERLIHSGKLPYIQFSDAKKWIPKASIDKFLEANIDGGGKIPRNGRSKSGHPTGVGIDLRCP